VSTISISSRPCLIVSGGNASAPSSWVSGPRDWQLGSLPELAERVRSFALLLGEDENANKTLTFAFELAVGAHRPADVEATRARFLDRLSEVNQDYREAARFIPQGKEPTLEFHAPGQGRFAGYDVRLKRRYVQSQA
jgi:hypothetical protein